MMLTVTRKMAKLLTVSRKSHHPENEICPHFEKSGNVDINTKLNGKQACQAGNCLLFFKDLEEPKPYIIFFNSNDRWVLVPSSCKFLAIV